MNATSHVIHAAPVDQPTSVHQIARRLFPAYTVDGGTVQLAGCTLEDRLFVRVEIRRGEQSREIYVDAEGKEVAGELVDALGMTQVARLERPPQPLARSVEPLAEAAVRLAAPRLPSDSPAEVLTTTAVWCKFAEGKLRFVVGDESADLPFSGWSRILNPPPYVCPYTRTRTFHLATTDDRRIVAAEQIERCTESNRRMLSGELVTCSVTGRRAMPQFIETCPVSGSRVLGKQMVECRTCRQRVSPAAVRRGHCGACRKLQPVSKDDPRMARVLREHPPLDRWPSWRASESATVYILTAFGWLNCLLVVLDKTSLELRHLATGHRLLAGWRPVQPSQYEQVLGQ